MDLRLEQIWTAVLGRRSDLHADFFADGGHSLLATRLLARVEREFGVRVGLRDFVLQPTRAAVARALAAVEPDQRLRFDRLVRVGHGFAKPVFAVIHSNGAFLPFGKAIGGQHPFVALQAASRRHPAPLPASTEAIAADYVKQLRQAEPSGPYVLLGWCLAGTVAYEAARQLLAAGQPVAAVVMVDTWCPAYLARMAPWRRAVAELSYSVQVIGTDFGKVLQRRTSVASFLGRRNAVRRFRHRPPPGGQTLAAQRSYLADRAFDDSLLGQLREACRDYDPQPIAPPVLFVRSSEEPSGLGLGRRLGWDRLWRADWSIVTIPGDHVQVFGDDNIDVLTRFIRSGTGLGTE